MALIVICISLVVQETGGKNSDDTLISKYSISGVTAMDN